ncbi:hypothetical protein Ate01nite_02120 [Actinoplanes teichomyceticus]|nr:hypothetical protein Ate01nite_02120 [Actinoplanes teichomyceticus]
MVRQLSGTRGQRRDRRAREVAWRARDTDRVSPETVGNFDYDVYKFIYMLLNFFHVS